MSVDNDDEVHVEAVLTILDNLDQGMDAVYRIQNLAGDLWGFTLQIGRWIQNCRVRHLTFHDQEWDVVGQFLGQPCFLFRLLEKLLWQIHAVERQRWLDDVEDSTELFVYTQHCN